MAKNSFVRKQMWLFSSDQAIKQQKHEKEIILNPLKMVTKYTMKWNNYLTTLRRIGSNDEQSFCKLSTLRASTITLQQNLKYVKVFNGCKINEIKPNNPHHFLRKKCIAPHSPKRIKISSLSLYNNTLPKKIKLVQVRYMIYTSVYTPI